MQTHYTPHYCFLWVILAHTAILLPLLQSPMKTINPDMHHLIIQAVMVAPKVVEKLPELKPILPPVLATPRQKKSLLKSSVPVAMNAPSEHTILQNTASEKIIQKMTEKQTTAEQSAIQHSTQETAMSQQETTQPPITPPSEEVNQLKNSAPIYPQTSRRLREQGVVLLSILVLADGSVSQVQLKQSSGFSRLDESALRAVKHWHFVAAKRGLETIDFWYELPIEFSLNN